MDSLLLTDGPALFGKGDTPWKQILGTAEEIGGVRFYLLNHGTSEYTPLETVKRDLEQYRGYRLNLSLNSTTCFQPLTARYTFT